MWDYHWNNLDTDLHHMISHRPVWFMREEMCSWHLQAVNILERRRLKEHTPIITLHHAESIKTHNPIHMLQRKTDGLPSPWDHSTAYIILAQNVRERSLTNISLLLRAETNGVKNPVKWNQSELLRFPGGQSHRGGTSAASYRPRSASCLLMVDV